MINYYQPSRSIVDFLEKELRLLLPHARSSDAGDKKVRNRMAKAKYDAIGHIFQAFADIVYFLEFIEHHEELHEFYERDLRDLFGINEDPKTSKHGRGTLIRLLAACLFYDAPQGQELDFQMVLISRVLDIAIYAMQDRIENIAEEALMTSDAKRVLIWSKLLASKVQSNKNNQARRSLGFPPLEIRTREGSKRSAFWV